MESRPWLSPLPARKIHLSGVRLKSQSWLCCAPVLLRALFIGARVNTLLGTDQPAVQYLESADQPELNYPNASGRDRRLDTLRGLFLVIMLIDHLGGYIADYTYQPFGFVSAAEGFIFLSGVMFGQIYGRYAADGARLRQRAVARALVIYRYHVGMVTIVALLGVLPFFDQLWYWALKPYHQAPLATTLAMLTLLHQPGYLDILPMYLLFVLLSVPLLRLLHRGYYRPLVVVSVFLWWLGQQHDPLTGLYQWLSIGYHPGYFNLFSWQILWMAGLLLGYGRLIGAAPGFVQQRSLLWLALTLAMVLWLWRRQYLIPGDWLIPLLDKPSLGPLRLFNAILLMLIGWRLLRCFDNAQRLPFLDLLGRYSIQVFSFHAVLLYCLQYTTERVRSFGDLGFSIYTLALIGCLLIPVVVSRRWRGEPNRWPELFGSESTRR